jgi:pimeloyl-ACP methyl ester carboxylesterase
MRRVLVLLAAVLLLLQPLPLAAAQDDTVRSATPVVVLPTSPVGAQLAWLLAQLNGGAATLTEEELIAHVTPAFLTSFLPAPALLDLLRQTASQLAPVTVTAFPFPPTATAAVALVDLATGEPAAIYLVVEPAPPHRITRIDLAEPPARPTPTGRRVRVGDGTLYLECVGAGGPTIVLEGGIAADWTAVSAGATAFGRVCAYDRPDAPGSRSDPMAEQTAQEVVDQLRSLLAVAGEHGPYVLVGHSLGGLAVQLFASRHPEEVAGLVLVDPTPETFPARLAQLFASLGTPVPARAAGTPPTIEEISLEQMREARAAGPLPPVPLIVLSHGRAADPADRPPGWPLAEEERIFRELHAELARLVPGGRLVIVEGAGHDIHQERPDLVVTAIHEVASAPGRGSPCGRCGNDDGEHVAPGGGVPVGVPVRRRMVTPDRLARETRGERRRGVLPSAHRSSRSGRRPRLGLVPGADWPSPPRRVTGWGWGRWCTAACP